MFVTSAPTTRIGSVMALLEVVFHATARKVRQTHGNALMSIVMSMMQTFTFVLAFYIMFEVMGMRGATVRGDFLIYLMSGIYLFLTHVKTLGAVSGAEGPTSPMMQHRPMNTFVAISSAALSALYIQILSGVVLLFLYYCAYPFLRDSVGISQLTIYDPVSCFGMLFLAWFTGLAVGLVFLAAKPWAPGPIGIASQVYSRVNMIASGKMFLANTMPGYMISMFDWNPLFHIIDQSRGFAFVNYNPHHSNWHYAFYIGIALLVIGMMLEFVTRKYASASWGARG